MPVTFSRYQYRSAAARCIRFARVTHKSWIKPILLNEALVTDFIFDGFSRIALPCMQLDLRFDMAISLTCDRERAILGDSPRPRAVNGDYAIDRGVSVIAGDASGEDADREIRIVDASVDRLIESVFYDDT